MMYSPSEQGALNDKANNDDDHSDEAADVFLDLDETTNFFLNLDKTARGGEVADAGEDATLEEQPSAQGKHDHARKGSRGFCIPARGQLQKASLTTYILLQLFDLIWQIVSEEQPLQTRFSRKSVLVGAAAVPNALTTSSPRRRKTFRPSTLLQQSTVAASAPSSSGFRETCCPMVFSVICCICKNGE